MSEHHPAPPRRPAHLPGELWGVTSYFNPTGYTTKRDNLRRFAEAIREQGLRLALIELARTDGKFAVDTETADLLVRVRSDAALWHKERLINLAIERLPESCDKVVWLDCDVLFENPEWVDSCARQLEQYIVVQPFESACWLPRGKHWLPPEAFAAGLGESRQLESMARSMSRQVNKQAALSDYLEHGHSGFAWAARRSLLEEQGLYDRLVVGGGDVVIGRSFFSATEWAPSPYPPSLRKHIDRWRTGMAACVDGSVGWLPGRLLHLWHGDLTDRGYEERTQILTDSEFDPETDIALDSGGCLSWSSDKPLLHQRVASYFESRREDG